MILLDSNVIIGVMKRQRIGPYDVMIAAQALRRGATLVTANSREFAHLPELKVEDWAAELE